MTEKTLIGLKALEKKLLELDARTSGRVLRNAVRSALLPAERKAKLMAPVGSVAHRTHKKNLVSPGFLKRSIRRRAFITRRGSVIGLLGVKPEAFYGVSYVEVGTKKMLKKPWLVPAFESSRAEIEARLKEQLKKGIDKLTR